MLRRVKCETLIDPESFIHRRREELTRLNNIFVNLNKNLPNVPELGKFRKNKILRRKIQKKQILRKEKSEKRFTCEGKIRNTLFRVKWLICF